MLSPDYSKRDYLLPEGCKDLIDVIRLEQRKEQVWLVNKLKFGAGGESLSASDFYFIAKTKKLGELLVVPPPITGDLLITEPVTVGKLAELLGQKPSAIIADLMQLGVFAKASQVVSFEAISSVARKYGYAAKKKS